MYISDPDGKSKCFKLDMFCDSCGAKYRTLNYKTKIQITKFGKHLCRRCAQVETGKKVWEKHGHKTRQRMIEDNPSRKDHVKEKLSKIFKGKKLSEEHKSKLRVPKKKKEKIKEASNRPEEIARRKDRMIKNNPMKNPETRDKVSKSISNLYKNSHYTAVRGSWWCGSKSENPIWCRSNLEVEFLDLCQESSNVIKIDSAESNPLDYFDKSRNRLRKYHPDFLIKDSVGKIWIVEIKSTYFQKMSNCLDKIEALKSYADSLGINYSYFSEKEIKTWVQLLSLEK